VAWALCVVFEVCLVAILFYRRNDRRFPGFTAYIAAALVGSVSAFVAYKHWGYKSKLAYEVSWSLQAAVTVLRTLAVMELCRHVLARYRGIWLLISRLLAATFVMVAIAAAAIGGRSAGQRVLSADRAANLALAVAIVGLFVFARYYQVQPREPMRSMAVGFFLYSCFVVLNNTILATVFDRFAPFWNFLSMLAFLSSLLVWCWALRRPFAETASAPNMLPAGIYQAFSPEVNLRLRRLNERLRQLSKQPAERP
jgi:hypothetical protein